MRRVLLSTICVAVAVLGVAAPAHGAFDDPLFFYTPQPTDIAPVVPPAGSLDGPCGLAVNSSGQIYISDYYHRAVEVFKPSVDPQLPNPGYASQPLTAFSGASNPHAGPLDDPCGLALDSVGDLYLNDYHREVVRFPAPVSLSNPNNEAIDIGDPSDIYADPTGVAVSPATNHAYVDDRTYLAEYTSAGDFVQKIGEGTLQDGYGITVSGYSATAGYLYVPDAATKTVKVFNPAVDTVNLVATITRPGGFGSLVDSAIAVDNATGEIYVADTLGPQLTESPQAIIYVFSSNGAFEGRLKHATIDAAPVGLAVDNSGGSTQSHVYVTSGITENAGIYGYPAHAATSASAPPLVFSGGSGESAVTSGSSGSPSSANAPPAASFAPSSSSPAVGTRRASGMERKRHRRRRARLRHRPERGQHAGKAAGTR